MSHQILCLEGQWRQDKNERVSVRRTLEHLEALGVATYFHRDVATREELAYYATGSRNRNFDVVFIAMHGSPGRVFLDGSDKSCLSLDELADWLGGALSGRVAYFGGCQTLGGQRSVLERFCRETGATQIWGYGSVTDWTLGHAFDLLMLRALVQSNGRAAGVWSRIHRNHVEDTARFLRLTVVTKRGVTHAADALPLPGQA